MALAYDKIVYMCLNININDLISAVHQIVKVAYCVTISASFSAFIGCKQTFLTLYLIRFSFAS